jgi:hypothetical protein
LSLGAWLIVIGSAFTIVLELAKRAIRRRWIEEQVSGTP